MYLDKREGVKGGYGPILRVSFNQTVSHNIQIYALSCFFLIKRVFLNFYRFGKFLGICILDLGGQEQQ